MPEGFRVRLDDEHDITAQSVIIASGVQYRRLDVPGLADLEGRGVYYAASELEEKVVAGRNAVVVGGANSAGQAALFLARHADQVHVLIRRAPLPSTTGEATTTSQATESLVVESTHYPYAVELAEPGPQPFFSADAPWDGVGRIAQTSVYVDRIFLPDRALFIVGLPWTDELEAFAEMLADHRRNSHSCTPGLTNRREVTIADTPGVAVSQMCEGNNINFIYVALVHDEFGLLVFAQVVPGEEDAAIDEVVAGLAGLEWRTG